MQYALFDKLVGIDTRTHCHFTPFVLDYPGGLVPEETFTHWRLISLSILYQPPSATIQSILSFLCAESMCIAVSLHIELFRKQLTHEECLAFAAAYFNDIIVGAVCSREERVDGQKRLYIMTLGCLAPYRRLGIGTIISHTTLVFYLRCRSWMNLMPLSCRGVCTLQWANLEITKLVIKISTACKSFGLLNLRRKSFWKCSKCDSDFLSFT